MKKSRLIKAAERYLCEWGDQRFEDGVSEYRETYYIRDREIEPTGKPDKYSPYDNPCHKYNKVYLYNEYILDIDKMVYIKKRSGEKIKIGKLGIDDHGDIMFVGEVFNKELKYLFLNQAFEDRDNSRSLKSDIVDFEIDHKIKLSLRVYEGITVEYSAGFDGNGKWEFLNNEFLIFSEFDTWDDSEYGVGDYIVEITDFVNEKGISEIKKYISCMKEHDDNDDNDESEREEDDDAWSGRGE